MQAVAFLFHLPLYANIRYNGHEMYFETSFFEGIYNFLFVGQSPLRRDLQFPLMWGPALRTEVDLRSEITSPHKRKSKISP